MNRRNFLKYLGVAGVGATLLKSNAVASNEVALVSPIGPNILFDSLGTQTMINNGSYGYPLGKRLGTILSALGSFGQNDPTKPPYSYPSYNISYSNRRRGDRTPWKPYPLITRELLERTNVYISLTRPPQEEFAYKNTELDLLQEFVAEQGGSILLHANHGPNKLTPPNNPYEDDYTHNNNPLAKRFGIQLLPYIVYGSGYMAMDVNQSSAGHELEFISNQAPSIGAHDSCIIVPPANFISIAQYPDNAFVKQNGGTLPIMPRQPLSDSIVAQYNSFAILVPYGNGNVIIVGNSGMITDYGSQYPSPGMIPMQSNLMFFLNCVSYLAGERVIPSPGSGPSI